MGWGTYVSDRVERLENDLRHVPAADRANVDYVLVWASLRDARILAELANISPDLEPPAAVIPLIPTPATKPPGWNWWSGDRTERHMRRCSEAKQHIYRLHPTRSFANARPICSASYRYADFRRLILGTTRTSKRSQALHLHHQLHQSRARDLMLPLHRWCRPQPPSDQPSRRPWIRLSQWIQPFVRPSRRLRKPSASTTPASTIARAPIATCFSPLQRAFLSSISCSPWLGGAILTSCPCAPRTQR